MPNRHLHPLGTLFLAALASLAAAPTYAQLLHPTAPQPSFDVATIKLHDPKSMMMITPPGSEDIFRTAGTGRSLVQQAFNASNAALRVLGGPDWIDKDRYDIQARIPDEVFAQMQKMTGPARQDTAHFMLQSLLADRFKLKVHFETREMPVYELVVAKDGPKLPPPNTPPVAPPGTTTPPPDMGGGEVVTQQGLRIRNMTLDGMLQAPWFGLNGRTIVNQTGLTGTYNLTLNWTPDIPGRSGSNGVPAPPENQADIFTVLQEQLGLKLVPTKDQLEIIVIDHIEPPSEN
jgi:uncharacterized protein (TIGR03435 family)